MGLPVNQKKPDRQIELKVWLLRKKITQQDLALAIGVSKQLIGFIIDGKRRSPWRIQQLVDVGVPPDLLPDPKYPKGFHPDARFQLP